MLCDRCQTKLIKRKDDTPDSIKNRLDFHKKETEPLFKIFDERNILYRVPGEMSIEHVFNQIIKIIQ